MGDDLAFLSTLFFLPSSGDKSHTEPPARLSPAPSTAAAACPLHPFDILPFHPHFYPLRLSPSADTFRKLQTGLPFKPRFKTGLLSLSAHSICQFKPTLGLIPSPLAHSLAPSLARSLAVCERNKSSCAHFRAKWDYSPFAFISFSPLPVRRPHS